MKYNALEVSIIMPAFNAEAYIAESIASVKSQSFQDWELIVIDDGSIDATASIVKRFQRVDQRIIYHYQPNRRLGAARNAGLRMARGRYIAFLDSDDIWLPDKLSLQVKQIENVNADLIFSNGYILRDNELLPYPSIHGSYLGEDMFKILFFANYIPVLSVLMSSDLVRKVGFQGEGVDLFGCEDWDYWLRLARHGAKFYGMGERLFKYRVHKDAMSRRTSVMKVAEFTALYRNIEFKYLAKSDVVLRLTKLVDEAVPGLVLMGRRGMAFRMVLRLLAIRVSRRYLELAFNLILRKL